jgi:hypothetical protein
MMKCRNFQGASALFGRPSNVSSRVSPDNCRIFVDSIAGSMPDVNDVNASVFDLLCRQFGFAALLEETSWFLVMRGPTSRPYPSLRFFRGDHRPGVGDLRAGG